MIPDNLTIRQWTSTFLAALVLVIILAFASQSYFHPKKECETEQREPVNQETEPSEQEREPNQ